MDPILYWNEVALETNRVSHTNGKGEQTGPILSARALAIVHLAMYEAYAGASGFPAHLPSYLDLPAPPGSPLPGNALVAAVAAAAHTTLSKLFPSQKPLFDDRLAGAGPGPEPSTAPGRDYGLAVAERILADRHDDPSVSDAGYVPSQAPGKHRPDPDNASQGFHGPFYGARSRCFAVSKRHSLSEPPLPGDREYLRALHQARSKGIAPDLTGTLPPGRGRTVDETLIGIFWSYDGSSGLGTPPRLYNQIVREVAIARCNDTGQNARLFALVNAAMADAGILGWDDKYRWDLWRPVLGIREHDESMGPAAGSGRNNIDDDCDPQWLPLGALQSNGVPKPGGSPAKNFTPPFPSYPSGHATFGAAAFHMTRLFYGLPIGDRRADNLFQGLTVVSDELNGVNKDARGTVRPRHVRHFPGGLWQMILENGLSRVFLGVHWSFDAFALDGIHPDLHQNIGGVRLGLDIAETIFQDGLKQKQAAGPRS